MSKGAYAKGTLPGAAELMRGVETLTLRGEVQRLRSALEKIADISSADGAGRDMGRVNIIAHEGLKTEEIHCETLSSSPDTGDTRSALEEAIEEIEEEMCDDFSPRAQRINMNLERIRECLGITITGMEEPEDG